MLITPSFANKPSSKASKIFQSLNPMGFKIKANFLHIKQSKLSCTFSVKEKVGVMLVKIAKAKLITKQVVIIFLKKSQRVFNNSKKSFFILGKDKSTSSKNILSFCTFFIF